LEVIGFNISFSCQLFLILCFFVYLSYFLLFIIVSHVGIVSFGINDAIQIASKISIHEFQRFELVHKVGSSWVWMDDKEEVPCLVWEHMHLEGGPSWATPCLDNSLERGRSN